MKNRLTITKAADLFNRISQYIFIFIFITLSLLLYFDSSYVDLEERFNFSANKDYNIGIFIIFVSLFIFINLLLIFTIKTIFLKQYGIIETKIRTINNFVVIYLILSIILITLLVSEMILLNSYHIYLLYSLLIISYFTAFSFSIWGTIKFLKWFKSNRDKLLLVYSISFISFCVLVILSLLYTLTELQYFSEIVTPTDLKRTIHAVSIDLSEIYPLYRISFLITFCSVWTLTAFLLYDYLGRDNRVKFWLILSIPLVIFLIEFFPVTLKLMMSLYLLNPSLLLPIYTIITTITTFIGAAIVSITFWLLVRKIENKGLKNYLMLVAFGLLLVITSTQETNFPRFLFPPFGLITILFIGIAIYLFFIGFYSASLHISKDVFLVKSFANRLYQYDFFRNMAKSQLEQEVKQAIPKILQSSEFILAQKEKQQKELEKENIEKLFEIVRREIENKTTEYKNNNK